MVDLEGAGASSEVSDNPSPSQSSVSDPVGIKRQGGWEGCVGGTGHAGLARLPSQAYKSRSLTNLCLPRVMFWAPFEHLIPVDPPWAICEAEAEQRAQALVNETDQELLEQQIEIWVPRQATLRPTILERLKFG